MFQSLLVPLDGSRFGEHALPVALTLARRCRAHVHVVHVHNPPAAVHTERGAFFDPVHAPTFEVYDEPGISVAEKIQQEMARQKQAYLDQVAQRLKEAASVSVTTHLLEGEIAESIRNLARNLSVSLVVMTTHGRGPLGRFWLGSVADELVRDLSMPLMLVHPKEEPPQLEQDVPLKHILLPLDGSNLSENMLQTAQTMGTMLEAQYTLLSIVKPILAENHAMEAVDFVTQDPVLMKNLGRFQEQQRQQAENYLKRIGERFPGEGTKVQTKVVVADPPGEGILEEAETLKVDLIALATHGRRGLSRFFLGSVADKVIRGSKVPVLVHHPPQQSS